MNPYLPLYEYIPDGEPRIFGDRLYVYGSHDEAGLSLSGVRRKQTEVPAIIPASGR